VESTLSQLQRQTPKIQPKTTEEEQKKKKNNISSNQQKNISNLPTFPRTKKINISEEKKKKPSKTSKEQQQTNQTHNRAGCVIFYTLVPLLKFHSKTTTKNRDLESFLSQLFSQFSSLKLRKCRPE